MSHQLGGEDSYILFQVAGATYALRSDDIQQLEMVNTITPVPNAPQCVEGVVSVRGQVIPAVNLRARFGFPREAYNAKSRMVVVQSSGRTIGLIVDSAREFAKIPADVIQPPPEAVAATSGRYLEGVAQLNDRLILILNVSELLEIGNDLVDASPAVSPAHA